MGGKHAWLTENDAVTGVLGDELECFDEEWGSEVVRVELFVVCGKGCRKHVSIVAY